MFNVSRARPWRPRPGWPLAQWLAFALLYFAVAHASLGLAFEHSNASPVWPPSGLALGGLLLFTRHERHEGLAWRFGGAILAGAFAANLASFLHNGAAAPLVAVLASVSIAVGNVGEAIAGLWLFRRLRPGEPADSPADFYVFCGASIAAAMVSATIGLATLLSFHLLPDALAGTVWLTWWLGDVTGMLLLAPAVGGLHAARHWRPGLAATRRALPTVVLLLGASALVFASAGDASHLDRPFTAALILAIVFAAWRHGRAGAALGVALVATFAIAGTLDGFGPFAKATTNDSLVSLDAFIALCALAGWVVAATLGPRADGQGADGDADARGWRLPVAVLAGCMTMTVIAWHAISSDTERQARARFEVAAADIRGRIAEHMRNYELALRGARGLQAVADDIDGTRWTRFVDALDLQASLPGLQGVGYMERRPGPDRDTTRVLMLAPDEERNHRVLGVDLSAEATRRAAIERARDTGEAAITAPLQLIQDMGGPPQAGFLMMLPVYGHGDEPGTVAERRRLARGYVYAPFRIRALMADILRPDELDIVSLDIDDAAAGAIVAAAVPGAPVSPAPARVAFPMFASDGEDHVRTAGYPHALSWTSTLPVAGRTWRLDVRTRPAFEATVDTQKAQLVLVAGGLISLLLFSVIRTLAKVREDALALAERMTREREQAEVRFRSVAESAGDGIAVWSDDGAIGYCNAAFAALVGQPVENLHGSAIQDLLPLAGASGPGDWHERLGARTDGASTHAIARADGAQVPVEISLGRWTLHGATSHVGIVRDVTLREAADALLRETQDNLNTVLDNMPAMVSSWTRDLRVRFINKEHQDWYGVDPSTRPGMHLVEMIGEAAFHDVHPFIRRALAGERASFERRIVSPDGRERWAQIHYIPDWRHGVVDGMIRLVFDITPLKNAQHELQASLQLHDVIFNHAGVGIALMRSDRYERASRHLTELFGYEEGGLDGQPASAICLDEANYVSLRDEARLELMCGHTFDREVALRHRDGSAIWCRMLARAVDPDDPSHGNIVIIQDFRDRRQREQLLEKARMAAESASRLKAEFLANMSHEIRTPMNGIIGMTRLTLDSALTEAQRENLEIVLDSASSLLHLLNDILDFSKIEAGKLELERAPFDLRERLWATAAPFAMLARGKGLELVLDVSPEVPERVTGDSMRLMQVVTNLLSNAVKFTASGSVTCRVDARPTAGRGCVLVVEVADTGPGMTADVQSRIFGSFVQADASVTREHGGTGLGLAICTQIVTLMDGEIRVDSTPGEGSTFRFDARLAEASAPPALPAAQRERLAGTSVLVVSGVPALRRALARQLAAAGARALEYDGAAAAAAAARLAQRVGAPYVAAIVDDAVPDLGDVPGDGLPPRVLLRSVDRPHGTPHDAGVHAVLRKPARPADLLAALCGTDADAPSRPGVAAATAPEAVPTRAARPLSLLLAEDHPVNQKLAQRLLERRGHRVAWARHGEEAVRMAAEDTYDVILMDIQMPVMDGLTALRAIREREAPLGRHTPIVALTAHALQGERERLIARGMDEYLSKPLDPAALIRVVESVARAAAAGAPSNADPARERRAPSSAATPDAVLEAAEDGAIDLPVVDRARALEGTQGDAGLLAELAALLRGELPRTRHDLRERIEAGDWGGASRAAHRLKGAAGNLQALGTQALAVRLEAACAAGERARAVRELRALEHELDRLADALGQLVTEGAT